MQIASVSIFFVLGVTLAYKNDIYQLASNAGFKAEPHYITTDDGYILTLIRLLNPNDTPTTLAQKEPVFLQHGLLGSCEVFAVALHESLAFSLMRNNRDVWLGNARGSFHSRNHTTLNPDTDASFWRFSLDQHGKYDIPAMIDYILSTTKRQNLSYVGHSQGSGSFFAMAAGRPEYNAKVKIHVAMAPAVYLDDSQSVLLLLSSLVEPHQLQWLVETFHFYEMKGVVMNPPLYLSMQANCGRDNFLRSLSCPIFMSRIESRMQSLLSMDYMPYFADTQPAGLAVYQCLHYAQIHKTHVFARYDGGPEYNMKNYNSSIAPAYDLSQVTAPVAILYGINDGLILPKNMFRLKSELSNVARFQAVANEAFTHLSFIASKNYYNYISKVVIEILNLYI